MQRSTRGINQTDLSSGRMHVSDVTGSVINKTGCKAGTTVKGRFMKKTNFVSRNIGQFNKLCPFAVVPTLHPVLFIAYFAYSWAGRGLKTTKNNNNN